MKSLKKNLKDKIKNNSKLEVMFFDESRFGTHSKIGHGWFSRGSRTQVKFNMGFKNFYVYSAVNSNSGNDFSLIMPYVDTQCMNIFLDKLAKESPETQYLIVMDGASWHRSYSLKVPANIEIIYLPPYSPELNPVERLWNYVKQHTIKNKFYDSLASLEQNVCGFLKQIKPETLKSVCACSYLYS
jgi:transposase